MGTIVAAEAAAWSWSRGQADVARAFEIAALEA